MKILSRESIPCWYMLAAPDNGRSLAVYLNQQWVDQAWDIPADSPMMKDLSSEQNLQDPLFSTFCGSVRGNSFGYNNTLVKCPAQSGFVGFKVALPQIWRRTGLVCPECSGTGESDFADGKCFHCNGTGKQINIEWDDAYRIAFSLSVLFLMLGISPECDVFCRYNQLFSVSTSVVKGMGGAYLGGEISPDLSAFLAGMSDNTEFIESVTAHMRAAYGQMYSRLDLDYIDLHQLWMKIDHSGTLTLNVPGDGCCLYAADSWRRDTAGYQFSSHNVDSPLQQLTFLVGLGAICKKAHEVLHGLKFE